MKIIPKTAVHFGLSFSDMQISRNVFLLLRQESFGFYWERFELVEYKGHGGKNWTFSVEMFFD